VVQERKAPEEQKMFRKEPAGFGVQVGGAPRVAREYHSDATGRKSWEPGASSQSITGGKTTLVRAPEREISALRFKIKKKELNNMVTLSRETNKSSAKNRGRSTTQRGKSGGQETAYREYVRERNRIK